MLLKVFINVKAKVYYVSNLIQIGNYHKNTCL